MTIRKTKGRGIDAKLSLNDTWFVALFARGDPSLYSPAVMHASSLLFQRPIVLVGLMGVGKTTIGRRLAKRLDLPFVDADHEIEAAAGMSVSDIFERFGESHFRDGERRVISRLLDGEPRVIATGGGAFMNTETRALILATATAIWIDSDVDTLVERVGRRNDRPLLAGRDAREVLAELAKVRNPVYALAPVHVVSHPAPHEATVDAIMSQISA